MYTCTFMLLQTDISGRIRERIKITTIVSPLFMLKSLMMQLVV
jgi:hypothetical protein